MRSLFGRRPLVALGVLASFIACDSPTRPDSPASVSAAAPRFVISDATHGGRSGFYFLPPMVAFSGPFTGEFDRTLSPVVRICHWVANACTGTPIVFQDGVGQEEVITQGRSYFVVWQTTGDLTVGDVYRVRVFSNQTSTVPLGFADLLVVESSTNVSNVPSDYIGVAKGLPFVIRFRVETVVGVGAVVPKAANDGSAEGSAPGDAYHGAFNTPFSLAAPGLLANDDVGTPAAPIASFGVISNGLTEPATAHAAGASVSLGGGGSLAVNADGSVSLTPPTGFTGYVVFQYRLTNEGGSSDATASIAIGRRPETSNDTYAPTLLGNVPINTATSTQFSVLTNDPADGLAAALVSATNGTATVLANGTFTFTPNAGFSGAASITYRATNGFGDAPTTATVALTVGAPVWFVNAGAAANGDGRFSTPFNCLSGTGCFDPAATDAPNEVLFLYSGSYVGGLTLLAGQRLIGQGASASFSSSTGLSWPADAGAEPPTGGAAPVIATSASSTNGLTLGSGNTIRGVNFGNATASALAGAGFGTLAVSDVAIATTGQALDLSNGTVAGSLSSVTSSGGENNVELSTVATTGTFALGTGALSGASGDAFVVTGGSGAFTYGGSVTNGTSHSVRVTGKTGGSVALSGDINPAGAARGVEIANNSGGTAITFSGGAKRISTGTAAGVHLLNNTGAAISFSGGGLSITTTTGDGFSATGGGTVTVSGAGNSLSASGGVALRVESTLIGGAGLTFRSISADGGSNGIVLAGTGSSGGLAVTGDLTIGSGGTIRNMTGDDGSTDGIGVRLESTSGVSLGHMNLSNHANFAIRGNAVAGFSMDGVRITGSNGTNAAVNEGSVLLTELTGSGTIARSFISGSVQDNFRVENTTGTLTSLAFSEDTVQDNSSSTGGNGIAALARGSAQMTVSVTGSLFRGNRAQAVRGDANATSVLSMTVSGSTFVAGSPNQGTRGVDITATADAQVAYDVNGNRIGTDGATNQPLSNTGVNVLADNRSTMTGRVRNNTIWNAGEGIAGLGIRVFVNDTANIRTTISGNRIDNVGLDNGLLVEASGADTQVPPAGTGTMDVALTGNTVNTLSTSLDAMRVQSRHNNRICARIADNASTTTANGFFGLLVRQTNASVFRIEGLSGSAGVFLAAQNPGVVDGVFDNGGVFTAVAANTCNIP